MKIDGIGPITATAVIATKGDANLFKNGYCYQMSDKLDKNLLAILSDLICCLLGLGLGTSFALIYCCKNAAIIPFSQIPSMTLVVQQ